MMKGREERRNSPDRERTVTVALEFRLLLRRTVIRRRVRLKMMTRSRGTSVPKIKTPVGMEFVCQVEL